MANILIVDDNEANLFMTKSLLEKKGYNIRTAMNGIEALERIRQEKPDIVISDILMPLMDGFTLCHTLKKSECYQNIPVLFITNKFVDPIDSEHGLNLGAEAFVRRDQESSDFIYELLSYLNKFEKNGFISTGHLHEEPAVEENKRFTDALIQKLQKKVEQLEDANKLLSQREESLGNLHNFLSNIINSLSSILICIDVSGKVIEWNNKAVEIFGLSTDSALGKKVDGLIPQIFKEIGSIEDDVRNRKFLMKSKVRVSNLNNIEFIDFIMNPLVMENEIGAVIQINDITGRVMMERAIIQSEKMLTVGGLAAGMAHEINNPLAGMVQTTSVLKKRLECRENSPKNIKTAEEIGISLKKLRQFLEDRNIYRMLDNITESGSRITEIIGNMLSYARSSDNNAISSHTFESIINKTLELISMNYDKNTGIDFKNIKIIKEFDNDVPSIKIDKSKMQQVILNILYNGAQAMFQAEVSEPRFIIRLKNIKAKNLVQIEIEDNGPGIKEEIQNKIFEPFFTTKKENHGTGLGLSVSYFIITLDLKGTLSVKSEPGNGANFIICLPVV